jgi:hypothetical protein
MVEKQKDEASAKNKSVYRIVLDFHPQFLKTIKKVYPLGVLSSLSMTIAAFITSFAKDSMVLAQTYAIAASLMFLAAFTTSLVLELSSLWERNLSLAIYAIFSYIFTASGIAFLFLVSYQFLSSVLAVATIIVPVGMIAMVAAILFTVPPIVGIAKVSKSKTLFILSRLALICCLLSVSTLILVVISAYGIIPSSLVWGYLLTGSLYGFLCFFGLEVIFGVIQNLRKKKQTPS